MTINIIHVLSNVVQFKYKKIAIFSQFFFKSLKILKNRENIAIFLYLEQFLTTLLNICIILIVILM